MKEWSKFRDQLFTTVSREILKSDIPLTGTPNLDVESFGLQYYDSRKLQSQEDDYNPAHMDSGTLSILIRASEEFDGLEVADRESTKELGSERIGLTASFLSVPANPDEIVVLAGTRLQRLVGKDKVRACVHRVRGPGTNKQHSPQKRISGGLFCGPSL